MKFLVSLAVTTILALIVFVLSSNDDQNSSSLSTNAVKEDLPAEKQKLPRVEMEETTYDFGTVDPDATYKHVFNVKNTGDATLILSKGIRSCDCAELKILHREIEPGETGQVVLTWEARYSTDKFFEGFQLITNDPERRGIDLIAEGEISISLRTEPGYYDFGSIESGKPIGGLATIFSQRWKDLHIQSVESSMNGLEWEVQEADPNQSRRLDATAAKQIVFKNPSTQEDGQFIHYLRVVASESQDAPESDWMTVDLQLVGRSIGRYTILCDKLDFDRQISLKSLRSDQQHRIPFVMKVAAEPHELKLQKFTSHPEGLEIDFQEIDPDKGVYRWDLIIPKGLPNGDYQRGEQRGWIQLELDHPEIQSIKLPLILRLFSPSQEVGY